MKKFSLVIGVLHRAERRAHATACPVTQGFALHAA